MTDAPWWGLRRKTLGWNQLTCAVHFNWTDLVIVEPLISNSYVNVYAVSAFYTMYRINANSKEASFIWNTLPWALPIYTGLYAGVRIIRHFEVFDAKFVTDTLRPRGAF